MTDLTSFSPRKIFQQFAVLAAFLLFPPLSSADPTQPVSVNMLNGDNANWQQQLRSGQIIVTDTSDAMDFLVLMLYPRFSPFFHTGIIEVENGTPYVYEANGEYRKTSAGGAPSDSISGQVKRISLDKFLDNARTINIFSPPSGLQLDKLLAYARNQVAAETPFDPYFDAVDHSRLYCSEFVALALEQATGKPYQRVPMRFNTSAQAMLDWMKVKDKTLVPAYTLVNPGNWLGTVSLDYSQTEVLVDRVVKLELYQRFTANQKIGNMMTFGSFNVDFNGVVQQFGDAAFAAFKDMPKADLASIVKQVRAIADDIFGVVDASYDRSMPQCQLNLRACTR